MTVTLATSEDYAEWTQNTAPVNIAQVLRSCTSLVLDATKIAGYSTDTDGNATDTDVAAALKHATCIQAAAWVALKIDPATGGVLVRSLRTSTKIGTGAITYDSTDTAAAAAARRAAYTGLVPAAARELRLAGLLNAFPAHT